VHRAFTHGRIEILDTGKHCSRTAVAAFLKAAAISFGFTLVAVKTLHLASDRVNPKFT